MHIYEINLVCPCCGCWTWESTETEICICTDCGHECAPDEMEIHYYETEV